MKQIVIFVLLIAAAVFAASKARSERESNLTLQFRAVADLTQQNHTNKTMCSDRCFVETSREAQSGEDLGHAMELERECLSQCHQPSLKSNTP